MEKYRIEIKKSAGKELARIPKQEQARIVERISGLSTDPRPPGSTKLSGEEKYRIRQGVYRILYEIGDASITIVVVRIAHRREVYR